MSRKVITSRKVIKTNANLIADSLTSFSLSRSLEKKLVITFLKTPFLKNCYNLGRSTFRDVYNVLFSDAHHGIVMENWSISEQLAINCSREINCSGATNSSGFGFSSKNYQDLKNFLSFAHF